MKSKSSVLCLGETMAMITPSTRTSLAAGKTFKITPGGAESNVASHLAARGFRTYWASRLGDDALGDRIEKVLSERGVDLSYVRRNPKAPTGVYFKDPIPGNRSAVSYYRKGSAASCMTVADAEAWPLDEIAWLHTSGITAALSDSCFALVEHVLRQAAERGYGTSFDVNYRPTLLSKEVAAERCLRLGRLSTVVFVGLDEAQALWNVDLPQQVTDLFPRVPHIVVKDGANEAIEFVNTFAGQASVSVPARTVEVVEAVGAGDAFAAGYLSALLRVEDTRTCLEAGHELAAWTLGTLDDFRAMPDQDSDPQIPLERTKA